MASGVNNAVARTGGLVAVAAIPVIVGLSGDGYADPALFADGFRHACWIAAALLAAGGVLAAAQYATTSWSTSSRTASWSRAG